MEQCDNSSTKSSVSLPISPSQSLCPRCEDIIRKLKSLTSHQPQNLTGYISLSSLRRLDCGICQLITYAYEKLAAWERPEYRNDRHLRERTISIFASRNHFMVDTHFYYWYSALSIIKGIRLSCAAPGMFVWQLNYRPLLFPLLC